MSAHTVRIISPVCLFLISIMMSPSCLSRYNFSDSILIHDLRRHLDDLAPNLPQSYFGLSQFVSQPVRAFAIVHCSPPKPPARAGEYLPVPRRPRPYMPGYSPRYSSKSAHPP